VGGVWQKKFTLNGFEVAAFSAVNSLRSASPLSRAQGNEPNPPALDTAAARILP
jgi:hypothetical protein